MAITVPYKHIKTQMKIYREYRGHRKEKYFSQLLYSSFWKLNCFLYENIFMMLFPFTITHTSAIVACIITLQ